MLVNQNPILDFLKRNQNRNVHIKIQITLPKNVVQIQDKQPTKLSIQDSQLKKNPFIYPTRSLLYQTQNRGGGRKMEEKIGYLRGSLKRRLV